MHAVVLFLAFAACTGAPLPEDVTPWEPGATSCPVEMPEAPTVDASDWVSSEPPMGGDVIIFGTTPMNQDLIYAGSGQNGIYRSLDQGFSWESLDIGTGHIYGQFTVAQENAECFAYSSGVPWASDNEGATVHPILLDGQQIIAQGVAFLGRKIILVSGDGEVYAVADCGSSAIQVGFLTYRPAPPSSAHSHGQISSRIWLGSAGGVVYGMDDSGVLYSSVDEGATWVFLFEDSGWTNVTFRVDDAYQWVVRQGSGSYEVQRRVNGGDLASGFTTVATVTGTATGAFLTPDGEYLVSGSYGIWSSEHGELPVGLDDEGRGIFSVGRVGSSLLAGYRAGVSVSPDNGASWGWTSEEMVDLDIANLHVHPVCPNVVFAGTQCRTGTFRSDDWGETWARVTADMHYTMGVDIAPSEPDQVWAVTDDELYMSKDMGLSWENRYPKGNGVAGVHYHGLGVSPDRPATVLVGSVGSGEYADDTARIYRTDNHGASWSTSATGLPASTESFHAIHFSAASPGTVLLGTYRAGVGISHAGEGTGIGVFRSTDLGLTWAQLDSTDALSFGQFAECDGRIYAATDQGILATDDLGDTWTNVLASAEDSEMLNVACAGDHVLAVDPALGVWRSSDAGDSWEDWSGSVTIDLDGWESQLGLELSPDGRIAYFSHPGLGVLLRGWE